MGLSDREMAVDPDGITDAPGHSIFAVAAAVLGILGLFAIVAPFFSAFCLASILCGLAVLIFAKFREVSWLSVRIASISIYLGLFCGLSGIVYYAARERIINQKAVEVATQYMAALSSGDRTMAIQMTGLPPVVEDADLNNSQSSREQQAVRRFLADPAIQEILQLGSAASWKATGLKAKYRTGSEVEMVIGFVDTHSTNPRPIVVTVKMMPPTKYTVETRNQWLVESVYQAPL